MLFQAICHFQQMLKTSESMKNLEQQAAGALAALLQRVPALVIDHIQIEPVGGPDRGVDILAHVVVADRRHTLVCEVTSSGQPRYVRMGLLQLRNYAAHFDGSAIPIFVAPYLSLRGSGVVQRLPGGIS